MDGGDSGGSDTHKTLHDCRGRKRKKASKQINDGACIPAAGATEAMQVDDLITSILTLDCIDIDYVRTSIIKTHLAASNGSLHATARSPNISFADAGGCDDNRKPDRGDIDIDTGARDVTAGAVRRRGRY
ncbi:hypothetical protein EVAR_46987_1 [Eumeta japonica]|uniref:Uncharacterized protein n=1 Tax=Eumeta variegata TaxID=151549 RepID=A0A4C1X9J0_EUMVA|nr:hypothetical protein EVAR_46987_1 [Eumeta japonica]